MLPQLEIVFGSLGVTLFLWLTTSNQVSVVQGAASSLLLMSAWRSYWSWRREGRPGLPLFATAAAMYWLYFGVPLFWGDRVAPDWRNSARRLVGDSTVTMVMLLIVFGIGFLAIGMRSKLGARLAPKHFPVISLKPAAIVYVQAIALLGTIMTRYDELASLGGEGFRQIVYIFEGTVSLTAIVILVRRALEGKAGRSEKAFLCFILPVRALLGISSGWLGAAIGPGIVCALVYMHQRRVLPIGALLSVLPCILFLQAGKTDFRRAFWNSGAQAGPVQKIEFWIDASIKSWQRALDDPTEGGVPYLLSFTLSRTALLTQTANVLEQTPNIVPYQYGHTYSYLAVALVPRFLWPDKPGMNEANQFYQVAYGVTREQDLNKVSISVGTLTEGYINFGWYGAALIMFLIGVLLDFWNETFLSAGGLLGAGIGIALIPQLIAVEFQMAQYVSGLVQHVVLTTLVFLPIIQWRRRTTHKLAARRSPAIAGIPS